MREFSAGANVRELLDALHDVPEHEREKEVVVMLTLDQGWLGHHVKFPEDTVPGRVTAFYAFPEYVEGPQPPVSVWTISAAEGESTAALVETLRSFQEFLDEEKEPG